MSVETFEPYTLSEVAQRPLSAGLAEMVCQRAGLEVQYTDTPAETDKPVVLVRQFGRYQDVETGEVWTHGQVKNAPNGMVRVVDAEVA